MRCLERCVCSLFSFSPRKYMSTPEGQLALHAFIIRVLIKLTIHRIHSFGAITYANNPLPIQITILPREFYLRGNFHIWLIIVLCKQSAGSTSLCVFGPWTCQKY